jgi:hypothetical protein
MANKNTRKVRVKIRAAGKRGEDSISLEVFRNQNKRVIAFPTARVNGDGVVSANKRRNSCQRVYVNKGNDGSSHSLTVHEPFLKGEYMVFPNHRQYDNWEYTRPQGQAST